MGQPASTRANEGVEYMIYKFRDHLQLDPIRATWDKEDYFVRLKDGKVVSYGKVGDFDSTKPDQRRIDLNVTEKKQTP